MNSSSPHEATAKAKMLARVFGDGLPKSTAEKVSGIASDEFVGRGSTTQRELIKLLAQQPKQRQQILREWRAVFPADKWAERLDDVASGVNRKPEGPWCSRYWTEGRIGRRHRARGHRAVIVKRKSADCEHVAVHRWLGGVAGQLAAGADDEVGQF